MTLAVSEAVTNAIIHAFVGRERGRVALTAEAGEGIASSCACSTTGAA